jgi:hypothetical protein
MLPLYQPGDREVGYEHHDEGGVYHERRRDDLTGMFYQNALKPTIHAAQTFSSTEHGSSGYAAWPP